MYAFPTAREVRRLLESEGVSPQKRWGQNFLIDEGHATRIVDLVSQEPGLRIWEIGPGVGALTGILLNRGCRVVAFEIDWGLTRVLSARFAGEERLELRPGDAAREWRNELDERGAPQTIIGNLPYRSAGAIIGSFLENRLVPGVQVFTVQREVADRMVAAPGCSAYSAFSVLVQAITTPVRAFDIPPGAFFPVPEVTSSVVVLRPRAPVPRTSETLAPGTYGSGGRTPDTPAPEEWQLFLRLLRALFRSRRKIIRKAVDELVREEGCRRPGAEILAECGLQPDLRAETIAPDAFLRLARAIRRETSSRGA